MTDVTGGPPVSTNATITDQQIKRARPRQRVAPWLAIVSTSWLVLVLLAAILADLLPVADPNIDVGRGINVGPFHSWGEPLGTDTLGRSVLSRLIFGARASLQTAVTSVLIAMLIGLAAGVLAAYLGGWLDSIVSLLSDSILAFPGLVLLMVLSAFLQPSITTLVIGLSILATPSFLRLARANAMRYTSAEFVHASRVLGARTGTIIVREIIPNVIGVLAAYAGIVTSGLVIAEASLSYLGLGIPPPRPSWGNLIADGRMVLRDRPYYVFAPALVLFLTVFSINVLGEWFRARSDGESRI